MRWLNRLLSRLMRCRNGPDNIPTGDPEAIHAAAAARQRIRRGADQRDELYIVLAELQARVLNDQRRP